MADSRSIYFVDSDDETRRLLREFAQLAQFHLKTFSHGESFLRAFDGGPGCLVAELQIEDMSGLELQQRLVQLRSKLPVIFVTKHAETHLIVRAMQNGATTVLQKPSSKQELGDAVTKAMATDREIRRIDARHEETRRRIVRLTPKEKDVLQLIVAGIPNKAIAKRLQISLRTAETRRQRIFQKTKCGSLAELIRLVIDAESQSNDEGNYRR